MEPSSGSFMGSRRRLIARAGYPVGPRPTACPGPFGAVRPVGQGADACAKADFQSIGQPPNRAPRDLVLGPILGAPHRAHD